MMQPKIKARNGRWIVRYDDYVTAENADGTTTRTRRERSNSFRTKGEAQERARAIEVSHAKGETFLEEQHRPVARLRDIAVAYAQARPNPATQKYRLSMMNKFLGHVGDDSVVTVLTTDNLRAYANWLRTAGLQRKNKAAEGVVRVDRFVGEIERLWAWADDREYAGVPKPRRIVGKDVFTPPPVMATDTPTWADCDLMIAQLSGWHARVATVLRYTGIRASQALTLDRSDIDLDRALLRLRAGARGAKGAVRHRAVPIHDALVEAMLSWDLPPKGPIFVSNDSRRKTGPGLWREDALVGPLTRAWVLSGVSEAKWGAPEDDAGGRVHARPAHSFRGAFKVGLLDQDVPDVIVNLLVGHATTSTQAAYVPESTSTTSPYWQRMVAALKKVPPIQKRGQVIALRAEG